MILFFSFVIPNGNTDMKIIEKQGNNCINTNLFSIFISCHLQYNYITSKKAIERFVLRYMTFSLLGISDEDMNVFTFYEDNKLDFDIFQESILKKLKQMCGQWN